MKKKKFARRGTKISEETQWQYFFCNKFLKFASWILEYENLKLMKIEIEEDDRVRLQEERGHPQDAISDGIEWRRMEWVGRTELSPNDDDEEDKDEHEDEDQDEDKDLPSSLQRLAFDYCFNQPVDHLKQLSFGDDFRQPVDRLQLPSSH